MSQALSKAEPLRLGPEAMGWPRPIAALILVVSGRLAAIAINALVGKAVFRSLVCLLAIAGATAIGGLGYGLSAALVSSVTILLIQPGDLTNAERAVLHRQGRQARVFDKFFRLDPALTRGVGGSGLGI